MTFSLPPGFPEEMRNQPIGPEGVAHLRAGLRKITYSLAEQLAPSLGMTADDLMAQWDREAEEKHPVLKQEREAHQADRPPPAA